MTKGENSAERTAIGPSLLHPPHRNRDDALAAPSVRRDELGARERRAIPDRLRLRGIPHTNLARTPRPNRHAPHRPRADHPSERRDRPVVHECRGTAARAKGRRMDC